MVLSCAYAGACVRVCTCVYYCLHYCTTAPIHVPMCMPVYVPVYVRAYMYPCIYARVYTCLYVCLYIARDIACFYRVHRPQKRVFSGGLSTAGDRVNSHFFTVYKKNFLHFPSIYTRIKNTCEETCAKKSLEKLLTTVTEVCNIKGVERETRQTNLLKGK